MRSPLRPKRPRRALSLRRFPNVYDAAFSWDRSEEAETYLRVARALLGRRPRSAVELACGSGPLARQWARSGVEVYGVDRSVESIERARVLAEGVVPRGNWSVGNLPNFRLPHPVDLAVVPMDSFGYLTTGAAMVQCLRAARTALAPGGVLAMDLTLHPEDGPPLPIRNEWKVALLPEGELRVVWWSQGRAWGVPPRRWEVARILSRAPGGRRQVFWEAAPHSILSLRRLEGLSMKAGGWGPILVFSDSAHRGRAAPIVPVRDMGRLSGARLVCWKRL